MKIEKKSIAMCILLSIVTCGIYAIIWMVQMAKTAVSIKDKNDSGTAEALLTIFLPFLGTYLTEKKFAEGCKNIGFVKEDRSTIYLVLGIFGLGIVSVALIQDDLNKLSDYIGGNEIVTDSLNTTVNASDRVVTTTKTDDIQVINEIKMYKELLDSGALTEEEFKIKKEQLLRMI